MAFNLGAIAGMEQPEDLGDFPLIPEGLHLAKIDSIEERKSKAGKDMIAIVFKIIDGPSADRLIFEYYIVDEALATDKNKEIALRMMWQLSTAIGLNKVSGDEADYVGKNVLVKIKHRQDSDHGQLVFDEEGKPVMSESIGAYKKPVRPQPSTPQTTAFGASTKTPEERQGSLPWGGK